MYIFLQNSSTMKILDPIFNRTLFLKFSPVPPTPPPEYWIPLICSTKFMSDFLAQCFLIKSCFDISTQDFRWDQNSSVLSVSTLDFFILENTYYHVSPNNKTQYLYSIKIAIVKHGHKTPWQYKHKFYFIFPKSETVLILCMRVFMWKVVMNM